MDKVPFEVVYIGGKEHVNEYVTKLVNGDQYTVSDVEHIYGKIGYTIKGFEKDTEGHRCVYNAKYFRRISPYQNSVSRSLAEQALKDTGDSRQDMKPERKEVLQ